MSYIAEREVYRCCKKIVFTMDVFRIDPNSSNLSLTPNKNNVKWLNRLLGDIYSSLLGGGHIMLFGDEHGTSSLRWRVYSNADLPYSVEAWARLYSVGQYQSIIEEEVLSSIENSLVVTFEASESLIEVFLANGIPYIDLAIHPVRFLDDYMFAVRTNVSEWSQRLFELQTPEHIFYDFAKVISAKAVRLSCFEAIPEGSVLFLAQTAVDSSLISDGVMVDDDMIIEKLIKMGQVYPTVYYKHHPYYTNSKAARLVERSKNMAIADYNIYMALGSQAFPKVCSFSSGTLHEAKYFGLESEKILSSPNRFANELSPYSYVPIYRDALKYEFWSYVMGDIKIFKEKSLPDPFFGAVKDSSGMKWGK
ncbi:hypothetical protein [Desulfovibrio gilichinskyi]|uniref:Capsule polysaccharide biosynthesis protein n=1 Tax=Desulfovibrio gilichinskyi TaxID=1519643 RepID=A0A1X7EJL9_9BACT|nr:hypothetical protein [Desulfovibrio gilichinskyi]SMF34657.1 hypothetical protein SAMN06295933_3024 [Desulfovibrio gilichinskyi]